MALQFAQTDLEANTRFNQWRQVDPFPGIQAALLNSADVMDYVCATGMIFPFNPGEAGDSRLKPASYEVALLGTCVYWDAEDGQHIAQVKRGEVFSVDPNSIAFVTLEPRLRIPSYIALRFNLTIRHVYAGLLLGTGPLVDPGFEGVLSIPLHNLTHNKYDLVGGEPLIWIEFTKLSPHPTWVKEAQRISHREGELRDFPRQKLARVGVVEYLKAATGGASSVRSSIPAELERAKRQVQEAGKQVREVGRYVRFLTVTGFIGLLALAIGLGALFYHSFLALSDARREVLQLSRDSMEATRRAQAAGDLATKQVRELGAEIARLEHEGDHSHRDRSTAANRRGTLPGNQADGASDK